MGRVHHLVVVVSVIFIHSFIFMVRVVADPEPNPGTLITRLVSRKCEESGESRLNDMQCLQMAV